MAGSERLTHVDETGAARMVDVTAKDVTDRTASAAGRVLVSRAVIELLRGEGVPKGDALAVARIAGIMDGGLMTSRFQPPQKPASDLASLPHMSTPDLRCGRSRGRPVVYKELVWDCR